METNATNVESTTLWLSGTRFNHIETIVVGCLIMFTENVSISKGAVNGTTTTVHEIEYSSDSKVTSIIVQLTDTKIKMKLNP